MRRACSAFVIVLLARAARCQDRSIPILRVSGADIADARQPNVGVAPDGTVHVVFVAGGRVLVSSLRPGQEPFEASVNVVEDPDIACGMRRGPRIAVSDEVAAVAWIPARFDRRERNMHGAGDVLVACSSDGGKTSGAPVRANDKDASATEGLHRIAAHGDRVAAAWLDHRDAKRGDTVSFADSKDGARTFSKNVKVFDPPRGTVCPCCHPSVAYGKDGASTLVLFRDENEGGKARDMFVSVREGQGGFASPKNLGLDSWRPNT
jgi:hypothetical protein